MNENLNTLFILAKFGVKIIDANRGVMESHMWLLEPHEMHTKYISLHETKASQSYIGGKIVSIREASNEEVEAHQKLMEEKGKNRMQYVGSRKVVLFLAEPKWCSSWPDLATVDPRAYKGLGYVCWEDADR